ncbi:HsdM family class I SAM-dependent methyltransferase [Mesorhizobium retamae]|uniref:site-specific DNA-methyltransferase (adenine-specific) n=1 Tax=Mesorhizobium retamae TaxID=2912854 RepID=A0ABS9QNV9_9HYPH|nr:N-6 DNA methylase [Mesorhizobium sp. IRAMC:0171]MCG7509137.1 SAM-dependent methyltransferase [Mesorhizobium sp. IRAMC:0171]
MARVPSDWRSDFGLGQSLHPGLFTTRDQLTADVPQAHILRHAFDLLELDGILCIENQPLIYFKEIEEKQVAQSSTMHRQFWNHGGAPILVLISPVRVHIFSGMVRPSSDDLTGEVPALIETLERVANRLSEFIIAVESGSYFHRHSRAFDPDQRVDRDLLTNLRDTRAALGGDQARTAPSVDALLCRLVFTCYLFDRGVIDTEYVADTGLPSNLSHLRDILSVTPTADAKAHLYALFRKLGEDFNGDLFSGDLEKEARSITTEQVSTLNDFFQGTNIADGQRRFWPYDFGYIPIEAISAIYEHFIGTAAQRDGAFYTPRFLVELVLDAALRNEKTLLDKTFLDPACGSGIFLVGLFNRIAEEWIQRNPKARNERRARELMTLMQSRLYGVDTNPIACRITAFSLYLAYLDKLSPRDIKGLQAKGRALPNLLLQTSDEGARDGNIICADFFDTRAQLPKEADFVIGNPPWGSLAGKGTLAATWCASNKKAIPDNQIGSAFVWKATFHVKADGHVCFVLPHGILLNHGDNAVAFQAAWASQNQLEWVLNLADLRYFLFNEAIHPAVVIRFRPTPPKGDSEIEYLVPKADWQIMFGEVITVSSSDRSSFSSDELLHDLRGADAPQLWTQRFWGSPRDQRLIDRLSQFPRLRDRVRRPSDGPDSTKPWIIAEGFQPLGAKDDQEKAKTITLPSSLFISAKSKDIDLFLLPEDCENLPRRTVELRQRSNTNVQVFEGPHVLITKGFQRIAFADFDVSFRHALRGIHGPKADRDLLAFLAAYLRTSLAQFFMFHTSSNWGIYRPEVHVQELLRLPMPMPDDLANPKRARAIVAQVAKIVDGAAERARSNFLSRVQAIQQASAKLESLIEEYFGIQESERILLRDTVQTVTTSIQPTFARMPVPSVEPANSDQRQRYVDRICNTLNAWAKHDAVTGFTIASQSLGVAVVILDRGAKVATPLSDDSNQLLATLERIRAIGVSAQQPIALPRDVMVFDRSRLYLVKSIAHRFWTETAALNDADQVASTLLMQSSGGA